MNFPRNSSSLWDVVDAAYQQSNALNVIIECTVTGVCVHLSVFYSFERGLNFTIELETLWFIT